MKKDLENKCRNFQIKVMSKIQILFWLFIVCVKSGQEVRKKSKHRQLESVAMFSVNLVRIKD